MKPNNDPLTARPSETPRVRLARRALSLALFLLPACAIATPWGLAPGAIAMLVAAVLGGDQLVIGWRSAHVWMRTLCGLSLLVLAVPVASMLWFDVAWGEIDNHARILVMPLFALLVVALRPSRNSLWLGAVAGLAGAGLLAVIENNGGLVRANGWANAIVFANVAVGLLTVAIFCRPPGRTAWVVLAVLLGSAAVLLTGSRGVWPALAVIGVVSLVVNRKQWRLRLRPHVWAMLGVLLTALAVLSAPMLLKRVDALQTAVERFDDGERDTSYGARRELLRVSLDALHAHPWTGVGVGNFDTFLASRPLCARPDARACSLDHAHSEFPQWAATMGLPGLLVALLLYGVPLVLLRRLLGDARWPATSAATAGIVFVICFVIGGLTQSMFAHQLTSSLYAILVGTLIGFGILEHNASVHEHDRS